MVDAVRLLMTKASEAARSIPNAIVRVPLSDSVDMVLAEDIIASEPFPPFRASVMVIDNHPFIPTFDRFRVNGYAIGWLCSRII
jgi:hypothetical protein